MDKCDICQKKFKSIIGLQRHKTQNPNDSCIFKCINCFKLFSTKQSLRYHINNVMCKKKFKCDICMMLFTRRQNMERHINKHNGQIEPIHNQLNELNDIIKNIPDNKHVNINIGNIYNNSNNLINKEINNNNNKISNRMINNVNFLETKPNLFQLDYIGDDILKNLVQYNEYIDEKMADTYLYEEKDFKENYTKEDFLFFEKKILEFEGCKMLFNELQKNSKNQNTRIKKSKSGTCYIYGSNGWEEMNLQKIITRISRKLCNFLYDRDTSVSEFINEIMITKPRRMTALRNYIEKGIINLNKVHNIQINEIEKMEEVKQIK